ncbi:MAG: M20/M25/M40 family metallo-hydrolase [Chloroflexota bacterium]
MQGDKYSPTRYDIDGERLLAQFMEMVRIDSPSFEEKPFLDYLAGALKAMGLASHNDGSGQNGAGNLFATVPGTDPGAAAIVICTHVDTVQPGHSIKPRVEDGVVKSDGTTILAADDKAAVAATLEAMRYLLANRPPHGDVELVFTWGEERGLFGSRAVDPSQLKAKIAFIADGGEPIGAVVTRAPYQNTISARFVGKAAHAGVEPEKGISAIIAASKAIAHMQLGRIDEETTANVGRISGGTARNAVPEVVEIEGEARSLKGDKLARQTEAMRAAMEAGAAELGAKVEINISRSYDGYHVADDELPVRVAFAAARSLGLTPCTMPTGGGADANNFNQKGLRSVVLGCGWADVHSTREHIPVANLELLVQMLVSIVLESDRRIRA